MEKSRPTVTISAAISVDGKIATKSGDSQLSSKKDLIRLHRLRSQNDAILIGTNTLHCDDPLLTVRHVRGKNPIRVILDSRGTISSHSQILQTSEQISTIIAVSQMISKKNYKRLQKFPVEIIFAGDRRIDLKLLLKKLISKKIKTLLVEGGAAVNWDFVEKNLYDKLVVTVSPRIIGGKDSVSLVSGQGFFKVKDSPKLRLEKTQKIGDELVLYYLRDASVP